MSDAPRRARVSLTKLQRGSAAGVELIALCRAIAVDGQLTDDEMDDLRDWLSTFAETRLPAHDYLAHTVRQVLVDGIITPEERTAIYAALEKVLPPDVRADVALNRRVRQAQGAAANRAIATYDFMVAGVRYGNRADIIVACCAPEDRVLLVRDPANRFSQHAVSIRLLTGEEIGYAPESDARTMFVHLTEGRRYDASVKKILTGGRMPIPVIVADFYGAEATVGNLSDTRDKEPRRIAERGKGCVVLIAVGLASVAVLTSLLLA